MAYLRALPRRLVFISADMRVCVFIHNAVAAVAARSCVLIYILEGLGSLPKVVSQRGDPSRRSRKNNRGAEVNRERGAHQRKQWLLNY